MGLADQFTAAMLAAGNKRSSIACYWRHVVVFVRFTSERHGDWIHPAATKIEDVHAWRRHLANDIKLSPKTQTRRFPQLSFYFPGCWKSHSQKTKKTHFGPKNPIDAGFEWLPNRT